MRLPGQLCKLEPNPFGLKGIRVEESDFKDALPHINRLFTIEQPNKELMLLSLPRAPHSLQIICDSVLFRIHPQDLLQLD